jgi:hypothetical protein
MRISASFGRSAIASIKSCFSHFSYAPQEKTPATDEACSGGKLPFVSGQQPPWAPDLII